MKRINHSSLKLCLASLFSFLIGCMITINLTPINKTCQLDKIDREYGIMANAKLASPELLILIMSAPKNGDKRGGIRSTWLKLESSDGNTKKFRHYFVVGTGGLSPDDVLHLSSEQSRYNDLLLLPLYDSYENLTRKVLVTFGWIKEQTEVGFDFKYVLKCDDDSFVKLDGVLHELKHIELLYLKSDPKHLLAIDDTTSPYLRTNIQANVLQKVNNLQLYWGYFHGKAQIKTAGKWKENNWILCDYYIPYALGGGYVLSKNLVIYLANNSDYLRLYKSEDVSVGAWLGSVDNVLRVHDTRFNTEWTSRGCKNYHLITHNVAVKHMQSMYSNIIKFGSICEHESTKRPFYLYNWNAPPTKCCNKPPS